MARTKPSRPLKTYNLYTRCASGQEPKTWASVEEEIDGHVVGDKTILVTKFGDRRGALIFTTYSYKALIGHAQHLAVQIGMPKSRIWDIFDWNQS